MWGVCCVCLDERVCVHAYCVLGMLRSAVLRWTDIRTFIYIYIYIHSRTSSMLQWF